MPLRSFYLAALVFVFAGVSPSEARQQPSTANQLDQIVRHLESDNPNRQAAARRQLREKITLDRVDELRAYLGRPLGPDALAILTDRLHDLLAEWIDEVESEIESFDAARQRVRQLILESEADDAPSTEPETATRRDERSRELESLRRERDELRARLHARYDDLVRQGLSLGDPLWERRREAGGVRPAVARFREQLHADLVTTLSRVYPSAPDRTTIPPYQRRALTPFIDDLRAADPTGWASFRENVARDGIELLVALDPVRRRDGRRLFLQLGDWGIAFLDEWSNGDEPRLPRRYRAQLALWNRYAVPDSWTEQNALDPATYEGSTAPDRLRFIHRLEWVGGTSAVPILARILELEADLGLKVEAAASLARLEDPRGGIFLRALGLEEVVAIETVSRRVLLLEAIHRREAGELDGALEDLQTLLKRFPGDERVHYELAFTALLARRLDLAIDHFQRSIEFDSTNALAHYNLACALALKGRTDAAIEALRQSVRHGFADPDHLQADDDLRSLRGTKDFENLVESLRESRSNSSR